MIKSLTEMAPGESGFILSIEGGWGMARRLDALGVRPGKRVVKAGAQFFRGPVMVTVDGRQIAVGFGMAGRVMVEVAE
ncbi:MAG: hypothetical protein AMS15_07510 [Planctomycetes bacterium DG_23]|nr:MAG: hypothetical protein AMS15_07510 [Planctomycetes bacterium DG_23]